MGWQELCANPLFNNLPFKVETNKWGKIEMSPASNEHGLYQALFIEWFERLANHGQSILRCGIQTVEGVKVADVAWGSYEFYKRNKRRNPYLESPEIVVEIISPSNTRLEMNEKKQLYFAAGAKEFWLCDKGSVLFFNSEKQLITSALISDFPNNIPIYFT